MNKAEKAVVALLSAQLDVMIATADRTAGDKSAGGNFVRETAAARSIADHYRKMLGIKAPAKKAVRKLPKKR